jgi:hypothetical protein
MFRDKKIQKRNTGTKIIGCGEWAGGGKAAGELLWLALQTAFYLQPMEARCLMGASKWVPRGIRRWI